MRDILLRVKTRDLQAVHEALAREFLERGERREYLFSPAELPNGEFGAWVRVNNEDDSRGREVDIPAAGDEMEFLLRAFAAGKGPDGKKRAFPAATKFDSARSQWLARQGAAHGFSIVREDFAVENVAVRRSAGIFGFNATVFSGRLKVTDAAKFENALRTGIGTRRGYGCGMLLARRVGMNP